jgi:hypothetical protein
MIRGCDGKTGPDQPAPSDLLPTTWTTRDVTAAVAFYVHSTILVLRPRGAIPGWSARIPHRFPPRGRSAREAARISAVLRSRRRWPRDQIRRIDAVVGKISMKKVEKAAATEHSPRFRENLAKLKAFEGGALTRRQAACSLRGVLCTRTIWDSSLITNDRK